MINFHFISLQALVELFELPPDDSNIDDDTFIEIEDATGYQAAYSKLNYAQGKKRDAFAEVQDGRSYFIQGLAKLSQSRPGEIPTLLATLDSQHQTALQKYCSQAGVQLV